MRQNFIFHSMNINYGECSMIGFIVIKSISVVSFFYIQFKVRLILAPWIDLWSVSVAFPYLLVVLLSPIHTMKLLSATFVCIFCVYHTLL